eukprot:12890466-Prorocentrum_lima.AAC.1
MQQPWTQGVYGGNQVDSKLQLGEEDWQQTLCLEASWSRGLPASAFLHLGRSQSGAHRLLWMRCPELASAHH